MDKFFEGASEYGTVGYIICATVVIALVIIKYSTKIMSKILENSNSFNASVIKDLKESINSLVNKSDERSQESFKTIDQMAKDIAHISKETTDTNKEMVRNNKELINSNLELQKQMIRTTNMEERMFDSLKTSLEVINKNNDDINDLKNKVDFLINNNHDTTQKVDKISDTVNGISTEIKKNNK